MEKKKMIIESLNAFIRSGECKRTTIHYDMNAIKIRLFGDSSQQAYMFYLYSPWRIVHNDALVNSSHLYPYEEQCESKEEYLIEFSKFCETTRHLESHQIERIELTPTSNDLTVYWENGCRLEKVCMDIDYDYHIYDRVNKLSYDLGFNCMSASVD
jgi:hypothetical protein